MKFRHGAHRSYEIMRFCRARGCVALPERRGAPFCAACWAALPHALRQAVADGWESSAERGRALAAAERTLALLHSQRSRLGRGRRGT